MPSKLYKQCEKCNYKDDCDEKRMAACAVANYEPMLATAAAELTQPIMQPMAVKHDYRDIWIDENTTITIDLEDLKEQMQRDFYKSVGLPGLEFGA